MADPNTSSLYRLGARKDVSPFAIFDSYRLSLASDFFPFDFIL